MQIEQEGVNAANSKLSGLHLSVYILGGIIVWLAECHSDSGRSTKFVIAMPRHSPQIEGKINSLYCQRANASANKRDDEQSKLLCIELPGSLLYG